MFRWLRELEERLIGCIVRRVYREEIESVRNQAFQEGVYKGIEFGRCLDRNSIDRRVIVIGGLKPSTRRS